ncbi:teichoic acids export ABC transporter ATP-binding subunit TagH [Bacillus pinisoli]|uniref:teichoic acids export ABC transporter ATP-binding subunit TagH n=1 Tax=Bacillus pinisoli TaxID=2901866 RepID=UPI001FF487F6|nr:teichoic acids export ABC transporter ATP-binding subunit TagH [Bacillus pinisoli]
MKPKVTFKAVTKKYDLYKTNSDKLLDMFFMKKNKRNFYALKDVSFNVYEGETIGVIGVNGSGKSTLSNLLAQIVPPTSGEIDINGETSLVAISAGLNNQLTGIENIKVKCLMHGLKMEEIHELTADIIEFAEIGDFINQPVKSYSSGMKSRLGFAISVHTNPDILVVDEALSVGDQTFYDKCIDKINDFKSQGKTIFFISHNLSQIKSISDKVLWINFGKVEMFDKTDLVLEKYASFIKWFSSIKPEEKKNYRNEMIEAQVTATPMIEAHLHGKRATKNQLKQKRKANLSLTLQASVLFAFFIVSILFMFIDKPFDSITNFFINPTVKKVEEVVNDEEVASIEIESTPIEIIQKDAMVKNEIIVIFKDEELTVEGETLPFASSIYLEEKKGNVYKVRVGEVLTGYVNEDDVEIKKPLMEPLDITINAFLPFLPDYFVDSYQYTLAFLGVDYEAIKGQLRGLTAEEKDKEGNNTLFYQEEYLTYLFNHQNVSTAIKVHEIDSNDERLNDILASSHFSSDDKSLYYLKIQGFDVWVDKNRGTIIFKENDENNKIE